MTTKLTLGQLQELCHQKSVQAGWWTDAKTGSSLLDNPFVVPTKMMLIVSEIVEAMEGDRCNLMDDKIPTRTAIEVEFADAIIRILDLAGALKLDLEGAIAEKMSYNAVRPDHKPEARAKVNGKKY